MFENQRTRFTLISWALFGYTLLVILWGAWVRISHSGDGCGASWPTCQDQFLPDFQESKTWIEYAHRLMSGLYGLFVMIYVFLVYRFFQKGRSLYIALGTLLLTLTEAGLGAKLVLSGLVAGNESLERVVVVALHQINSLLLSGSILLVLSSTLPNYRKVPTLRGTLVLGFFILIAISGSWAALAGSLFPSSSLLTGIHADWDSNSHIAVRLRVLHPALALAIGTGFLSFLRLSRKLFWPLLTALFFGVTTLLLLSPTWMKIAHLGMAHGIWAALILRVMKPQNGQNDFVFRER